MQTAIAIGAVLLLLVVGVPFAITYPWRVAMLVSFLAVHVLAMVGYDALVERLKASPRPAARRLAAAHAALAGLLAASRPGVGRGRRLARGIAQAVFYGSAFVFYIWLLSAMGGWLDRLEGVDAP